MEDQKHLVTSTASRDIFDVLLFILAGVLFLEILLVELRDIGFSHDELWDYPAAVAALKGDSIQAQQEIVIFGYRLPLVSGPYQGAIKSWLLMPMLALAGVSPLVLRGINCVLALLYILSLYWALRALWPRQKARWLILLPFFDPTFLLFSPMDYGPFLIQTIFIALSLGFILRALNDERNAIPNMIKALFCASVVLAAKLTSLPFQISLCFVVLAFPRRVLRRLFSLQVLGLITLAVVVPLLPNMVYFFRQGFADALVMTQVDPTNILPYPWRVWQNIKAFFFDFLVGQRFLFSFIPRASIPQFWPIGPIIGILLFLLSPLLFFLCRGQKQQLRGQMFLVLFFLLFFLIFSLFSGLTRPWHYFVLHPVFILMSSSMALLLVSSQRLVIAKFFCIALVLLLPLASGVNILFKSLSVISRDQGTVLTTPELSVLQEKLGELNARKVICVSYSMCYPLYVLSGGELKVIDGAFWTLTPPDKIYVEQELAEPQTVLIYRTEAAQTGKETYIDWLNRGAKWIALQEDLHKEPYTVMQLQRRDQGSFTIVYRQNGRARKASF